MEEPFKNSKNLTKEWIQEAGLEQPSTGFQMKILERIESKSLLQKTTPLLNAKGWFVCGFVFVASVVLLYVYPLEMLSFKGDKFSAFFKKMGNLKAISISTTTQYAFLFLALFYIQIPFLKHYLEKQRI